MDNTLGQVSAFIRRPTNGWVTRVVSPLLSPYSAPRLGNTLREGF